MDNLKNISRELQRKGKTEALKNLADSPDGQRLSSMLDKDAVRQAMNSSDGAALKNMLSGIMQTDEGRRLSQQLMKLMQD